MDRFTHAISITRRLAETLGRFETLCAAEFDRMVPPESGIISAIHRVWPRLVDDARLQHVYPSVPYIASIFHELIRDVSLSTNHEFTDREDFPWEEFYVAGCGDENRCEDAWVVADIYWGGYVPVLSLTLGWLIMNAFRLQDKQFAIIPDKNTVNRFIDDLKWSGPDCYDAENFRALLCQYEQAITVG